LTLSQPTLEAGEFESEFVAAVCAGLDKIMGESGTQAVLYHLKMGGDRPAPDEVDRRMVALFGRQATTCIEMAIVLDLARRLDLPPPNFGSEGIFDFIAIVRQTEKVTRSP
jgi:hypothetical protein